MAKQTINLGTGELTGDGESIRSAFSKVNENFNEVYTGIPVDISELTDTQGLLNSGSANIGDVTFDGVKVIGAGTASGDGFGYSTLELVPDNNLYANNQYLVIDPTAPSHIHIRAGGPQDGSNADLFLGGEKTYVRVRDNQGVRMQTETQQSTGYFNFNTSVGFSSAAWQEDGFGGYQIIINDPTPDVFTAVQNLAADSLIEIYAGTNYIYLTATGNTGTPGGGPITFGVLEAPSNDPITVENLLIENFVLRTNSAELSGPDFTVNVYDDVRITGSDIVSIRNRSTADPITIITDWDNSERTWSFGVNGDLNLPQDGGLIFDRNNTSIRVGMGFHIASGEGISIDAIDQTDPNNLITKGWYFSPTGNLTLPGNIDSINSIALQAGDAVNITSNNTVSAKTWTFDETGNLTLPAGGNILDSNSASVLHSGAELNGNSIPAVGSALTIATNSDGGLVGWNSGALSIAYNADIVTTYLVGSTITWQDGTTATITGYDSYAPNYIDVFWDTPKTGTLFPIILKTSNYVAPIPLSARVIVTDKQWTFNPNGNLTFPDTTIQTTAWAGGRVVAVPASSIGVSGNKQGDIAFNGSYMYYCTQDFAEASYSSTIVSTYTGLYPSIVKGSIPQPQAGWAFIHNGTTYTLASNAVENNPGEWTCELTTSISVTAGDTVTLGPVFSADIWKRIAWSTDTW